MKQGWNYENRLKRSYNVMSIFYNAFGLWKIERYWSNDQVISICMNHINIFIEYQLPSQRQRSLLQ